MRRRDLFTSLIHGFLGVRAIKNGKVVNKDGSITSPTSSSGGKRKRSRIEGGSALDLPNYAQ